MSGRQREGFADRTTRAVLGVDALIDRLDPDSERARRAGATPRRFGPDQLAARRRTVERLEETETWADAHPDALADARRALARLPDIRPLTSRIAQTGASSNPRNATDPLRNSELFQFKQFFYFARKLLDTAERPAAAFELSRNWKSRLADLSETIHPGGGGSPRFRLSGRLDSDLDRALDEKSEIEAMLRDLREPLEEAVGEEFDGQFALDGTFRPAASDSPERLEADDALEQVDGEWQIADEELRRLEDRLGSLEDRLDEIEQRVRRELTDRLAGRVDWLEQLARRLTRLDLAFAKVRLRRDLDGCWGEASTAPGNRHVAEIEQGRLPGLRELDGETPQAIDFELGEPPAVVTGPNMGGKSSLLALVGLCQWCAQHAIPVPADAFAFRPVERIVYVGSEEPAALDASEGLSAFGREIRRLVEWRERTAAPTLWLLDEIGRGTHPEDGARLANRIIGELHEAGHYVLAATHFPEVAAAEPSDARQIRGIVDPETLEDALDADATLDQIERTLREAMDFQPTDRQTGEVPRGARIVARALGLDDRG